MATWKTVLEAVEEELRDRIVATNGRILAEDMVQICSLRDACNDIISISSAYELFDGFKEKCTKKK